MSCVAIAKSVEAQHTCRPDCINVFRQIHKHFGLRRLLRLQFSGQIIKAEHSLRLRLVMETCVNAASRFSPALFNVRLSVFVRTARSSVDSIECVSTHCVRLQLASDT